MAKKKVVKRKRANVRTVRKDNGIGIEFHSWTFYLFLLFVLIVTLLLAVQRMGYKFF